MMRWDSQALHLVDVLQRQPIGRYFYAEELRELIQALPEEARAIIVRPWGDQEPKEESA